jgi:hypothetical protein
VYFIDWASLRAKKKWHWLKSKMFTRKEFVAKKKNVIENGTECWCEFLFDLHKKRLDY